MHRLPALLPSLCSLLLAAPAAAAPGPIVPLSSGGATLRVVACGNQVEESGSLPLSVSFNFSVSGCAASGSADLVFQDGALQVAMNSVALSIGVGVQVIGELDDLSFAGPELGEAVSPVFTTLSDVLQTGDDVTLLTRTFSSSGRYKSTLLGGEIDAAFGGDELSGPQFFVPNDAVAYVPVAMVPAATLEASWAGSLFGGSSFEARVVLEAFLPPSAAPVAPALSASGRVALGIGLLFAAGYFASRRRTAASGH